MRRNIGICLCFSLALLCIQSLPEMRQAYGQPPQPRAPKKLSQHLNQWFQQLKGRISQLQQQLQKTPKARRFPLLMKLAKEYERVIKIHGLLVKKYGTYQGSSLWTKLQPLQLEARRQAILFRIKAAQLYQMILSEYPQDPRLCGAYYGLAKHLYGLKKPALSYQIYRALLDAYQGKSCTYKAQAYLALGEQQLRKGKTKAAIKLFQQTVAQGHTGARAFALYKLGRAYYRQMSYTKAMGYFIQALRYMQTAPSAGKPQNPQALRRQLRQQIVLASSHVAQPHSAVELFQKVEPLFAQNMAHLLAGVYKTQGKFAYAASLQLSFAQQAKGGAEALTHLRLGLAYKSQVSPDKAVRQAAQMLVGLLQKHSSLRDDSAFRKAALKLHVALVRYGMARQKKRQYKAAIAWYQLASRLLKSSQGSEMLFWQGEAHMALRQYGKAASSYHKYITTLPAGRYAKLAAYNQVLARDKGLQAVSGRSQQTKTPGSKQARAQDPRVAGMYQASRDFLRKYGTDPRALAVYYRYIYYAHRFDDIPLAQKLFWQMYKAHPKHPYTSQAARLILALFHKHKAWKAQTRWTTRLLQQQGLHQGLRTQLQQLHFSARLQLCLQRRGSPSTTQTPPKTKAPDQRPASQPSSRPTTRATSRPTSRVAAPSNQPTALRHEQRRRLISCLLQLAKDAKTTPALAQQARQRAVKLQQQLKKQPQK